MRLSFKAETVRILPIIFAGLWLAACGKSPSILWKFQTGGPIYSSPAIAGNFLIAASSDGNLYALDLLTGAVKWKQYLGSHIFSSPLIYSGVIYLGGGDNEFYAIQPLTGKILWQTATGGRVECKACADDSGIYFGSNDQRFQKIGLNGAPVWNFPTQNRFSASCVLFQNIVATSCWDSYFYALDRNSGTLVWKKTSGTINYGSPELAGSDIYFATHKHLFRLNATTGQELNQVTVNYLKEILFWNHFLWTNDAGLEKRSPEGNSIAKIKLRVDQGFKPVVVNDYLVLSGNNRLYAVSPDLEILWEFKGNDSFWIPGSSYNNIYYTGNRDGYIYALKLP